MITVTIIYMKDGKRQNKKILDRKTEKREKNKINTEKGNNVTETMIYEKRRGEKGGK